MSTNRSRRIDRDAAEQLLTGAADGTQGGRGALADLLAAAAGPATAAELAGEEAALAAFREAAQLSPGSATPTVRPTSSTQPATRQPRRPWMTSCAPVRFLSAKVAVVALAATAVGGVAMAAGGGYLPTVLGGSPDDTVSDSAAATASARPSGRAVDRPDGSTRPPAADQVPGDRASAQLLAGLCLAWAEPGQATADSRFEPLTRAAGGPNRVRDFCADLLASPSPTVGPAPGSAGTPPAGSSPGASSRPAGSTGPSPSATSDHDGGSGTPVDPGGTDHGGHGHGGGPGNHPDPGGPDQGGQGTSRPTVGGGLPGLIPPTPQLPSLFGTVGGSW
ncbi:hypothetical protein ACIGXM_18635 [Kitasatospora sp. NPDC052896]|uniref:hypothetical protein n=1 Tax=Kitasatospora sp. NPDC052896 TaxID=3364061 RepID=UPI0037CA6230